MRKPKQQIARQQRQQKRAEQRRARQAVRQAMRLSASGAVARGGSPDAALRLTRADHKAQWTHQPIPAKRAAVSRSQHTSDQTAAPEGVRPIPQRPVVSLQRRPRVSAYACLVEARRNAPPPYFVWQDKAAAVALLAPMLVLLFAVTVPRAKFDLPLTHLAEVSPRAHDAQSIAAAHLIAPIKLPEGVGESRAPIADATHVRRIQAALPTVPVAPLQLAPVPTGRITLASIIFRDRILLGASAPSIDVRHHSAVTAAETAVQVAVNPSAFVLTVTSMAPVLAELQVRDELATVTARAAPITVPERDAADVATPTAGASIAGRLHRRPVLPPFNGSFDAPSAHQCTAAAPTDAATAALKSYVSPAPTSNFGAALAAAARSQTNTFVLYNAAYFSMSYPSGDVPALYGVCTDVVIRAYRQLGIDLQAEVFHSGVGRGDRNIDHRRAKILDRFFKQSAIVLQNSDFADDYSPGDIVVYHRPQNTGTRTHIALVADRRGVSGDWMIVHNRGWGPQLEDALFVDEIIGHYRFDATHARHVTAAADLPRQGPSLSAQRDVKPTRMTLKRQ